MGGLRRMTPVDGSEEGGAQLGKAGFVAIPGACSTVEI